MLVGSGRSQWNRGHRDEESDGGVYALQQLLELDKVTKNVIKSKVHEPKLLRIVRSGNRARCSRVNGPRLDIFPSFGEAESKDEDVTPLQKRLYGMEMAITVFYDVFGGRQPHRLHARPEGIEITPFSLPHNIGRFPQT
ncbi:hypothetical protein D3C87_1571450 [compost metagenome]